MNKVSSIGALLKKIYKIYIRQLISILQGQGYVDLRPSFLEVLLCLSESEGVPIKSIGKICGLKKQTMTSHLNELEKRGYLVRKIGISDKREQHVYFTEYGEKFRLALLQAMNQVERDYTDMLGEVEIDRIEKILTNFHQKVDVGPTLRSLGKGISLEKFSSTDFWSL